MPKSTVAPPFQALCCPVCGRLPFLTDPAAPTDQVPTFPAETECEICGAQLVRDKSAQALADRAWTLRPGTVEPAETRDWSQIEAERSARHAELELAALQARNAETLRKHSCPHCGEQACKNLGKLNYNSDVQRTECDHCGEPVIRRQDPRGPAFGYGAWEQVA